MREGSIELDQYFLLVTMAGAQSLEPTVTNFGYAYNS